MRERWKLLTLATLTALVVALAAYLALYRQRPLSAAQRAALERIAQLDAEAAAGRIDWQLAIAGFTETEARAAARRDPAVHFLFLGIDRRADEPARSDAIHLLRFEPGRLTLFSVPRDALVGIRGRPEKVNAAYAHGGAPLAIRTIEDLVKIRIDGHLELDLPRFSEVARIAKTVTLDGRLIGAEEVFRHIDGLLSWLRNRSLPGGDFRRIQRQQLFIARALDWTLTLYQEHPTAFAAVVQPILNLLPTDISYPQVTALCEKYSRQPLVEHAGWTPPALAARHPALAELERFYLPGKSAVLDVASQEVIDSTVVARRLAADAKHAGGTNGEGENGRYLAIYLADTRPLRQLLESWRRHRIRANYALVDSLPGEDTAVPASEPAVEPEGKVEPRSAADTAAATIKPATIY